VTNVVWDNPDYLKFLWFMPVLFVLLIYLHQRKLKRFEVLAEKNILDSLIPNKNIKRTRFGILLITLSISFMIAALASPKWGVNWKKVTGKGLDIIIVLDTSKSMLAEDVTPNRLTLAKWAVKDLVKLLKGDRIGLVAFAGGSFMQCPLTLDYSSFYMMLEDLYAGIIPYGGTSLSKALETAIKGFKKSNSDKAIILISDGDDTEDLTKIIKELKEKNIKVFSIGVGTLEGGLIPERTETGSLQFHKDKNGKIVKTSLNEEKLKQIALETGGFYVRSIQNDFGIEKIYKEGLAKMAKGKSETKLVKSYHERYYIFLIVAFALLFFEAVITGKFKK
jgi:Ca-activated chloride channel family protein